MNVLTIVATLARRGLLAPNLPHRVAAQLASLVTWGAGLAGEVRQAALASPHRVAVIDEAAGPTTYADLFRRSCRVGAALRGLGVTPGQRVGLLARNHVGALETMVGVSVLGADLVLCNTGLVAEQLGTVVEQEGITLLVHDEEFTDVVAALPDPMKRAMRIVGESELAEIVEALPAEVDIDRPTRIGRTIILTSGTTGTPRGAARRTPRGVGPLVSIIDRIPLRVGETVLVSAPVFHTWGFAALQLCFALRATVVLQRRFSPASAAAALEEFSCTGMFAVPVMLQRMIETVPRERVGRLRRTLRIVATSGSAFPSGFTTTFMDEYGDVLYNLYGSTEASWVCIATPADLRRHPDTAGTPPLGTVVRILDPDGRDVAPGATGRIFAGNDLVFDGYTAGDGKEVVDGLVSTGDIGHVEDGLYFVDGREDDMIVSGGENVHPIEVESLLQRHPAIREVAVVGVPDEEFGQRLAAFVVLVPGRRLSAHQVREHVREHRARHCIPREVILLDELPRNTTGKVLTRELRARFD